MLIGLIGCGRWGSNILRDLLSLGCEVGVVVRSDATRQRALAAGAADTWAGVDAMPVVDGVVVATPTPTHAEVVASVLDREVPVFCEKPLGTDSAAMARLVEGAGDRLFVMDKWRYHPGVETMRDLSHSHRLGPLRGLTIEFTQWGSRYTDVHAGWVLLPHVVSIALEVVGEIPAPRRAAGPRLGTVDGELVGVMGAEVACAFRASTVDERYQRRITALFQEGVVTLTDGYADRLELRRPGAEDVEVLAISTRLPLQRELEAFIGHVAGGPAPRSAATEGLEAVVAIVDLLGSARW